MGDVISFYAPKQNTNIQVYGRSGPVEGVLSCPRPYQTVRFGPYQLFGHTMGVTNYYLGHVIVYDARRCVMNTHAIASADLAVADLANLSTTTKT